MDKKKKIELISWIHIPRIKNFNLRKLLENLTDSVFLAESEYNKKGDKNK